MPIKDRVRAALDRYGTKTATAGYIIMAVLALAASIAYHLGRNGTGETLGQFTVGAFVVSSILLCLVVESTPANSLED